MPDPDYYQILGVDPRCSEAEIETAYRSRLSENFNRDGSYKPGVKETVEVLNQAYVVLTDPFRRKQYDFQQIWDKRTSAAGDTAQAQPAAADANLPDWLRETMEYKKAASTTENGEISEWMAELIHEAEKRKQVPGDQRTIRVIIFISLLVLLTITLLVTLMVLTQR